MGPGGDGGLSVGGNPTFAGKGFGGGGFGIMDIGGSFTGDMMRSNPNFTPNLYGLPTTDRKTGNPIDYGVNNLLGSVPGGFETTAESSGGTPGVPLELVATARNIDPMDTLSLNESMFNSSSFTDSGGISSLSPTAPTPFQPETGIFGGTLGPKLKNAFPPKLRKFLGNIAKMHPATANAVFMGKLVKGYQRAEDKGAFLKKVGKSALIHKAIGNKGLGLSRTQQKGVGSLMNVLQGKQNMAQGLASFGTSAVFQKMGMPLMKKAFQSGGMPAVYGVMSALNMAQKGAQRGLSKKLAGPPGGG